MTSVTQAQTQAADSDAPVAASKKGLNWPVIGNAGAIALITVWCLAPFYWMVVMSLRDANDPYDTHLLPNHFSLSNYRFAFNTSYNHFGRSLINGVIIGGVVTIVALAVGVFAAYALARLQFRGFCIFILTTFFTDMPWELEQAAKVDGATPGQAFRLVIFPLAAPALFTTAILVFLGSWNEFLLTSQLYEQKDSVATPTVALAKFTAGPHLIPYTQTMAAGVVITVPLVIVVLLFQRRIVSGLTAGGVKG